MSTSAVEIRQLKFSYWTPQKRPLLPIAGLPLTRVTRVRHPIFDGFDVNFQQDRITALIGRNGSGKTTLIQLISGIRLPEAGTVRVFGKTPQEARRDVGVCMGGILIYHRLSGRENLEYFGDLYGVADLDRRIDELARMLDLGRHLDSLVESYSFGMKMKLAVARSMIHSPRFLILDEPTLGIDRRCARQIWECVRQIRTTVLLTTHRVEEVEALADDLCFLDQGRILDQGMKEELLERSEAEGISDLIDGMQEEGFFYPRGGNA